RAGAGHADDEDRQLAVHPEGLDAVEETSIKGGDQQVDQAAVAFGIVSATVLAEEFPFQIVAPAIVRESFVVAPLFVQKDGEREMETARAFGGKTALRQQTLDLLPGRRPWLPGCTPGGRAPPRDCCVLRRSRASTVTRRDNRPWPPPARPAQPGPRRGYCVPRQNRGAAARLVDTRQQLLRAFPDRPGQRPGCCALRGNWDRAAALPGRR